MDVDLSDPQLNERGHKFRLFWCFIERPIVFTQSVPFLNGLPEADFGALVANLHIVRTEHLYAKRSE